MSLGRSGVVLAKSELGRSELDCMRRELTVRPIATGNPFSEFGQSFRVYHETKHDLCIPRHYYSRDYSWTGGTPAACPLLVFTGRLKSETRQPEAAKACAKAFQERGGGILSLPTGFGKTTVGLYVACQLGLKTLVVAHKEFLIDQWIERIRSFVPTARIGRVQQDTCDTADKDIVVAMMQSVCSKDYGPHAFDDFGLLIIDEVHHISAPTFCRTMYRACCPYVLGLSATPERKDGLTRVIEWFVGPVFFKIERKAQQHVRVKVIKYTCGDYARPPPQTRSGTLNLPELISQVCMDPVRNRMVLSAIDKCVAQGRKTIVLSDRRNHCMDLLAELQTRGIDAALYIGGMKQEARKESEKSAVIIATYSQANEGLDIPSLNALVMATPKSDVVQAVGRILREASGQASDHAPLVIDFLDDYGIFYAQFAKRRKYYTSVGFDVLGSLPSTNDEACAFVKDD